jgi:hypothetical protein
VIDVLREAETLAHWSDGPGLAAGVDLAERHRELLSRRLAPAQLAGLQAVARAVADAGPVISYVQGQASRAQRAGLFDIEKFWRDTGQAVERARAEASKLGSGRSSQRYVRELVQHLTAHCLYLRALARPL